VTLVMTMSTGAASARRSLDGLLNSHYPVDLVVDAGDDGSGLQALPAGTATRVSATHGIDRAVEVPAGHATAAGTAVVLYALTVDQARSVLRDHSLVDALTAGSALVPASLVPKDGSDIALSSASHPQAVSVTAAQASVGRDVVIVTPALLTELAPQARPNAVWARLSDGADAATVLADVQDSLTDRSVSVSSSAAERAGYERIIDTLLAIVLGLLGVAVLIALIGVTNTLSLSVLERRRESATLRAVGLTRRQLRGTLAVEGMTIAVVGAVLGIVLGMVYGWAGAEIVFGSQTQSKLAVPWTDIASTLVVALLAGLLASVLPARSAARTPPVAALATE
jgi:putative ABC transport system permease protein